MFSCREGCQVTLQMTRAHLASPLSRIMSSLSGKPVFLKGDNGDPGFTKCSQKHKTLTGPSYAFNLHRKGPATAQSRGRCQDPEHMNYLPGAVLIWVMRSHHSSAHRSIKIEFQSIPRGANSPHLSNTSKPWQTKCSYTALVHICFTKHRFSSSS